jgi:hypothetical protein
VGNREDHKADQIRLVTRHEGRDSSFFSRFRETKGGAAMNAFNTFTPTMSKFLAIFSGRFEAQERASKIPLAEHFEAYKAMQIAHRQSKARIDATTSKLRRIVADCGWQTLADFSGPDLEAWLDKRSADGMSPGNRNEWRVNFLTFANWCVRTQRLFENPFAMVPRVNARLDRTFFRRDDKRSWWGEVFTRF